MRHCSSCFIAWHAHASTFSTMIAGQCVDHDADGQIVRRHWHNGWEGHEYKDLLQAFRDEVATSTAELPHIIWKEMVPTHFK